jgi:medium-chain acyl-[acyl-carrier-protein] hydrolase
MADLKPNLYLARRARRTRPEMRLFCFPYAGGSAMVFQKWHRAFPESIEICPIQYPGRGNRLKEQPFTSSKPLAHEVTEALLPVLDVPFAFFGHSMGALIAFDVTRELRRRQKPLPRHLFLSAVRAPQLRLHDRNAFDLPEPEFIEELRRLNGTPNEVLENAELMELMIPMLRADFSVAQAYEFVEETPLSVPMSVYGGTEDPSVSITELEGWREQTTGPFSVHMFGGDHFYLHSSETVLMAAIQRQLVESKRSDLVQEVSR